MKSNVSKAVQATLDSAFCLEFASKTVPELYLNAIPDKYLAMAGAQLQHRFLDRPVDSEDLETIVKIYVRALSCRVAWHRACGFAARHTHRSEGAVVQDEHLGPLPSISATANRCNSMTRSVTPKTEEQ